MSVTIFVLARRACVVIFLFHSVCEPWLVALFCIKIFFALSIVGVISDIKPIYSKVSYIFSSWIGFGLSRSPILASLNVVPPIWNKLNPRVCNKLVTLVHNIHLHLLIFVKLQFFFKWLPPRFKEIPSGLLGGSKKFKKVKNPS